jgi:hypothetical protein
MGTKVGWLGFIALVMKQLAIAAANLLAFRHPAHERFLADRQLEMHRTLNTFGDESGPGAYKKRNSLRCSGDGYFDGVNGYVVVRRRVRDYRFRRLVRPSSTSGRDVFLDEHVEDLCPNRANGKLQPRAFLR